MTYCYNECLINGRTGRLINSVGIELQGLFVFLYVQWWADLQKTRLLSLGDLNRYFACVPTQCVHSNDNTLNVLKLRLRRNFFRRHRTFHQISTRFCVFYLGYVIVHSCDILRYSSELLIWINGHQNNAGSVSIFLWMWYRSAWWFYHGKTCKSATRFYVISSDFWMTSSSQRMWNHQ